MPVLTIRRKEPTDAIHLPLRVSNPTDSTCFDAQALFDTGCDHTVVRMDVFDKIGLSTTGKMLGLTGVTGTALGQSAKLHIFFTMDDGHIIQIKNHEVVVHDGGASSILLGRDSLQWFNVSMSKKGTVTFQH